MVKELKNHQYAIDTRRLNKILQIIDKILRGEE